MARGMTTRNKSELTVGRPVGGCLTRLEECCRLVSKRVPFGAKTAGLVRRQIDDLFYRFWSRFTFKYEGPVQMKDFAMLRKFVKRDCPAFSGSALESFFRKKMEESGDGRASAIGGIARAETKSISSRKTSWTAVAVFLKSSGIGSASIRTPSERSLPSAIPLSACRIQ